MTSMPSARPQIFLVEDDPLILLSLKSMVVELGYQVAATSTNLDGAMKTAMSVECHAAILDVKIGNDMSYAVAEILEGRGIPFAFATGYADMRPPTLLPEFP
jgi:response regulator RpfG family c-di-GMP phosphodiesterase